jgi:hypothetical protein
MDEDMLLIEQSKLKDEECLEKCWWNMILLQPCHDATGTCF